jgi:hypothetical protein
MKKAIQEYIELKDIEKEALWNEAFFVFDTNVFLNLYRYSKKTREILLGAMEQLKDRIWMPNHVAHEFMENRIEVIFETIDRYTTLHDETNSFMKTCVDMLRMKKEDSELVELQNYIETWIDTNKRKNLLITDVINDPILDKILELFDGKVGNKFDDEEMKQIIVEGNDRYEKKIPPGYKDAIKKSGILDNNAYGDLIVWKEILRFSKKEKKNIIYVTHDQKEDWWNKVRGKTVGPRVELRREFMEETNNKFHMYTMNNFIRRFEDNKGIKIDQSIIDEVKSVQIFINEKSFKTKYFDIYSGLSVEEKKLLKLRNRIEKLENSNRKRRNSIARLEKKYSLQEMPDEARMTLENTKNNLIKGEESLEKYRQQLYEMESMENKQLSLW